MKVLAAAEPLSLQLHPSATQAVDGHRRGIYPDDQAKPELICALTPFDALCGIRPVDGTLELLDRIGADDLAALLRAEGAQATVTAIYRRTFPIDSTLAACADADDEEAALVRYLAARYPADPSVVEGLAGEDAAADDGLARGASPAAYDPRAVGDGQMRTAAIVVRRGERRAHGEDDESEDAWQLTDRRDERW